MKASIFFLLMFSAITLRADLTVEDAGSYIVNYPAVVTHETKEVDTVMGKVSGATATCTNDSGYYGVIYYDISDDKTVTNLAGFYQEMLDLTVKSEKLKLLTKTDFKCGGITGLDYSADYSTTSATTHGRIFLVGHRLYQVIYIGNVGNENSKPATDFLNSFRLLR